MPIVSRQARRTRGNAFTIALVGKQPRPVNGRIAERSALLLKGELRLLGNACTRPLD
jgi:hypothetical protein